jgi:hypothetical protein
MDVKDHINGVVEERFPVLCCPVLIQTRIPRMKVGDIRICPGTFRKRFKV